MVLTTVLEQSHSLLGWEKQTRRLAETLDGKFMLFYFYIFDDNEMDAVIETC